MNTMISVIIPLYKGTRYIDQLLEILSGNCNNLADRASLEVVFVNDCSNEMLSIPNNYAFPITVLNNETNLGIHQSRINGLMASQGNYISFWDQDDEWSPYFLKSQLEHIGDADAVFCDAIYRNGIHCFDSEQAIERVTSDDWYMRHLTGIISPGQALIRRSCIPNEWTQYVMHTNYCDDAFLWLLMKEHKCRFVVNRECLYNHVEDGKNTSIHWDRNIESFKEMYGLIEDNHLLSDGNMVLLQRGISERLGIMQDCLDAEDTIKDLQDRSEIYRQAFVAKDYKKISVYGFGNIGVELARAFDNSTIRIAHIYDRDAVSDEYNIERLDNCTDDSDLIIVSIVLNRKKIIDWVRTQTNASVISILDLKNIAEN